MSLLYLSYGGGPSGRKSSPCAHNCSNVKHAIEAKHCTSEEITRALCGIMRETDVIGWYVQDSLIGIIGAEIGQASAQEVRKTLSQRSFTQPCNPSGRK